MSTKIERALPGVAFDPALTRGKMVLVAGPRQAGKTTMVRAWLERVGCGPLYYNWDDPRVRRAYRQDPHFFEAAARGSGAQPPWIAVDELHKATRWRDILKGWFDVFGRDFRFVVTGSARLDLFRRAGDSLVGRYFLFHLFPLSFGELSGAAKAGRLPAWLGSPAARAPSWDSSPRSRALFDTYLRRGPFPEPLLADSDRFSRRWATDYLSLLVRQDLRDLTRITQLDRLESLVELLPGRVGSPVSYSSLGRVLETAHTSVRLWLEALRRLYLVFPVRPYARNLRRALRREPKWYFLDWAHVPASWARLENLVASVLWQACQSWTDAGLGKFELRYLRTLDKKEIDFVLLRDGRPAAAIEVKEADVVAAPPLVRRESYLGCELPGLQVVGVQDIARRVDRRLWVVSADRFLSNLA
ncbi:MAG: ATP-binding protein [Planctomycetes bacterium]|nr:ATP-binding protein [Planctomycetota bacterium]